jgi:carbon-monoxide dehydrogenase medium subunit
MHRGASESAARVAVPGGKTSPLTTPAAAASGGAASDNTVPPTSAAALRIGAMTRQRAVERSADVERLAPLVHQAMPFIAHPQIRNRGTIGGSLAHADPASELPAVALALGAEFAVTGPNGERTIAAKDFFVTFLTTALDADEVLTAISFPRQAQKIGCSVQEVARRHGDFALAGAAVTVKLEGGRCSDARIALFGVGATAVRASGAEEALRGAEASDAALDAAADVVREEIEEPLTDIHASSEFRRHLARTMVRRALATAVERARNGGANG